MSDQPHPGGEFDHVPICTVSIYELRPSPENDKIYRPVQEDDPGVVALAQSIAERGILEPLISTSDYFIVSGHRRFAAAKVAGLHEVPCRILDVTRQDPGFLGLLRDFNLQRVKSRDEAIREEAISVDPAEAYESLLEHRRLASRVSVNEIQRV